jgi:hypothetical protein
VQKEVKVKGGKGRKETLYKPFWECIKYPEVSFSELVWEALRNSPYQGDR